MASHIIKAIHHGALGYKTSIALVKDSSFNRLFPVYTFKIDFSVQPHIEELYVVTQRELL